MVGRSVPWPAHIGLPDPVDRLPRYQQTPGPASCRMCGEGSRGRPPATGDKRSRCCPIDDPTVGGGSGGERLSATRSAVTKGHRIRRYPPDRVALGGRHGWRACSGRAHTDETAPHGRFAPVLNPLPLTWSAGSNPALGTDTNRAGSVGDGAVDPAIAGTPALRCVPARACQEPKGSRLVRRGFRRGSRVRWRFGLG
jgi:hypothetical protein